MELSNLLSPQGSFPNPCPILKDADQVEMVEEHVMVLPSKQHPVYFFCPDLAKWQVCHLPWN